ncbi:hypothetical protein QBC34DRAFT_476985 [Podospora aff. communis PSN243]|uniref:Apple domain-containing protein n=1 Tax=Podospora aff. communis PSN243 TaxID=3040156 RepID=A0AAV9G8I6_9PEZI|nr:hypothetical protein QBC34DRAFT_476985 [Podospora aff. communis PSN243]
MSVSQTDYQSAPQVVTGSGHGQDGLQVAQWRYDESQLSSAEEAASRYEKPTTENQQKPVGTLANMKRSTFWLILGLAAVIIIGVSVGGAVGGSMQVQASASNSDSSNNSNNSSSSSTNLPGKASPTRDCPATNGTTYKSAYTLGTNGAVPEGAGLSFQKLCSTGSPGDTVAAGYFQSFDLCIELCASLNFRAGNRGCVSVDYKFEGAREPVNCWAHGSSIGGRRTETQVDTAVLV